jgi:hypothetical protein
MESLCTPFFGPRAVLAAIVFFPARWFEEVFDSHDHDLRLAAAVPPQALILSPRPGACLPKLVRAANAETP